MLEIISSDKMLTTVPKSDKPPAQPETTSSVIKVTTKLSTYQTKSTSQNSDVTSSNNNPKEKIDGRIHHRNEAAKENKDSVLSNTRFQVSEAFPKNDQLQLRAKRLSEDSTAPRQGKIIKQIHQKFLVYCFRGDFNCS